MKWLDNIFLLQMHQINHLYNSHNSGIFDLAAKIKKKIKQFYLLSLFFHVALLGLYPINTGFGDKK